MTREPTTCAEMEAQAHSRRPCCSKFVTSAEKVEKVVKLMEPHYNDVYAVICEKGHTNTTTTQPLMKADGTYINMGDLKIGTELKNVGKVQSIVYSGERRVYDLQVDGENNYIADGFTAQGGDDSFWTA